MIKSLYKPVLWTLIIVFLSTLPNNEFQNNQMDNLDKVVHFFLYAILSYLYIYAFVLLKQVKWINKRPLKAAVIVCFSIGMGLEIIQGTVFASRSFEFKDVLANTLGILLGSTGFYLIYGNPLKYTHYGDQKKSEIRY